MNMKQTAEFAFFSMHVLAGVVLFSAGVFLALLGTATSQALTRERAPESLGVRIAGVARYNGPGNSYAGATAIAINNAGHVSVTGGSGGSGGDLDDASIKYSPGRR